MRKFVAILFLICLFMPALPLPLGAEDLAMAIRKGEITQAIGEVNIKKAGEDAWQRVFPGFFVSQYDIIKITDGSSVDVEFGKKDGHYFKMRLRDNSQLTFTNLEIDKASSQEDILLDLVIGDILIKTEKLPAKSKFRVRTPTSMVGVKGTRFEVKYDKPKE